MYGYESFSTVTNGRLCYKLQTRLHVRESAPRRRAKQLSGKRKKKKDLVMGPKGVSDIKIARRTDRRSQHKLNFSLVQSWQLKQGVRSVSSVEVAYCC
jgi:hypothetical protein